MQKRVSCDVFFWRGRMRFYRGFCENIVLIYGFIVVECGAICGECGEKADIKIIAKKVPPFSNLFF
jgi:hypothetical protein